MLKRVCAVALVVLMTLAMVSCGGEKRESKVAAVFGEINQDSGYHMDTEMDIEGTTIQAELQAKGSQFYVKAQTPGREVLLIRNSDGFFMLLPSAMMGRKTTDFGEMDDSMEAIDSMGTVGEDAKKGKFKAGEMGIDGTKYYFEEFKGAKEQGKLRFAFEGDELRYLLIMDEDEVEGKMKINALGPNVDENVFKVPDGYTITEGDF